MVTRVNAVFSTPTYQPIGFLHTKQVTFSRYLVLLTGADVTF
jgi:trehalose-6-phosphate synthase